jgi:hypothetical protein
MIAIFLIDHTLGKAFDSQCNNEYIFQNNSRGMQSAKEMLSSNRANFYMNPRKSETNDSFTFKHLSVPIPNDIPASTMSSCLSQLTVVPNSSFLYFHVPMNATRTATGLTSLNDVTIAHVSATTATTTATMTQVPTTRSATMNAQKYNLNKCKATRIQHTTMSSSILHPTNTMANHATSRSLFLLHEYGYSKSLATFLIRITQQLQRRLTHRMFCFMPKLAQRLRRRPTHISCCFLFKTIQPIPSFI